MLPETQQPARRDGTGRLPALGLDLRQDEGQTASGDTWTLPQPLRPPAGLSFVTQAFSRSEQGSGRFGIGLGYAFAPDWTLRAGLLAPGLFTGISGRF